MLDFWPALTGSFSSESRFYWPFVAGLGAAFVANLIWYGWRDSRDAAPAERGAKPWAFWINVIVLIWATILAYAKAPVLPYLISFAANIAALVYLYRVYLPPREAAWEFERRRRRYIPQPKKQRRRR